MAEEVEAKFFVDDYNNIIKKILAIATFKKAAYELTLIYDNNSKTLFRDDARLRLRRITDFKNKKEEVLTSSSSSIFIPSRLLGFL